MAVQTGLSLHGYPLRGFLRDLRGASMGARGGQEELRNPGLILAAGTGTAVRISSGEGGPEGLVSTHTREGSLFRDTAAAKLGPVGSCDSGSIAAPR
jgi:hypothetical protein